MNISKSLNAAFLALVVLLALCVCAPAQVAQFPTAKDTQYTLLRAANKASTTLTVALNSSGATATVASTATFPASGRVLLSSVEFVDYTSKDGTHLFGLVRGREGTNAQSHLLNGAVQMTMSADFHNILADAVIGLEGSVGGDGWGALKNPRLTTTQRDALVSPQAGWTIWNTTTGQGETYTGSGWVGAFVDPMSARGDIVIRNSSNVTARLARGAANTVFGSDGTDVGYSQVTNAMIVAGAGIPYSKLTLTGGIGNGDISASAGIVDTKLATIATAGKVSDSALSANVPLLNANNAFTGTQTGPFVDKGGGVFNAAGYTDIQAAIDAAVAAGKPSVVIPAGTYHISSHLVVGNGNSTTASTLQGFSIIGQTGGLALGTNTTGLVKIIADNSMNEIILINGPMSALRIENVYLDCNGLAQTGIRAIHTRRSTFRNIEIHENTGVGFVLTAHTTYSGAGGVGQILENVRIDTAQNGAIGFDFGVSAFSLSDVAQVHCVNCVAVMAGTGTTGVILRGIDSSIFSFLDTRGATTALQIIPPTGGPSLPDAINCYHCALESSSSTMTVTGTWTPAGGGLFMMPFGTIDAEVFPADSRMWGLDTNKNWHGAYTFADQQTFTLAPNFSTMTSGSMLYAGTSGVLSQDSSNLTFNSTSKTLTLGGANNIGTTPTDGFLIRNTTAAAAGAQQISPASHWSARGWKTDAPAGSQSVDFRSYVVPVEGAANPTGYLSLQASVNGAAYNEIVRVNNTGGMGINLGSAAQVKNLDVHVVESGVVSSVLNLQNDAIANGTGTGMLFSTLNASSAPKFMGGLSAQTVDNTSSAEQGRLNLRVMKAGSLLAPVTLDATDGFKLGAEFPLTLDQSSTTPANPSSSSQARIYVKGSKFVVVYNDAGTVKYFTMSLTQAVGTATWSVSTSAP